MKKRICFGILCAAVCAAMCLSALPVAAAGTTLPEIPYGASVKGLSAYTNLANTTLLSGTDATANAPAGFSGEVLELTGSSDCGATLHYADLQVPAAIIESLTFRVYPTDKVREVRVTRTAGSKWQMRLDSFTKNAWNDVTLSPSQNLYSGSAFEDLFDGGYLADFELGFRLTAKTTVYVDHVKVNLKPDDKTPPVITYTGATTVSASAGKQFLLDGATGYDATEKRNVPLTYNWSAGAVDEKGLLKMGTHTCTVSAADFYGNTSTLKITVKVGDKDVTPPVIGFKPSEIRTVVGTIPQLNFKATDDFDPVTVVQTWSDGAFDSFGRLKRGTHTLTLTAADRSGNKTEKVVKVIVGNSL